jgi:hypothetical protein
MTQFFNLPYHNKMAVGHGYCRHASIGQHRQPHTKWLPHIKKSRNLLTKYIITITIDAIRLKDCEQWLWYCPSLHLLWKINIFFLDVPFSRSKNMPSRSPYSQLKMQSTATFMNNAFTLNSDIHLHNKHFNTNLHPSSVRLTKYQKGDILFRDQDLQ